MGVDEATTIRLILTGARQVALELEGTAAAVGGLTKKVEGEAVASRAASRSSLLLSKSLSTLKRFALAGTTAVGFTTFEVLKLGFAYTSAMQQARVALRPVFSSTKALSDELSHLFTFSAFTPFQFKDITVAFRQMYGAFHPLGISLATTNLTLQSMTDALSFVGRNSPAALNRVAVALQHMAYMGHLTGQVVMQLARDGLPIYPALAKELHLTGDEIHRIGNMGISSAKALRTLNMYISQTPGYAGAAMRQATKTLAGAVTTFKDLLSQAIGSGESGLFGGLQSVFQKVDLAMAPFYRNKKPITVYALATAFDSALTPKTHLVINALNLLVGVERGLLLELRLFARAISTVLAPLRLLGGGGRATAAVLRALGYAVGIVLATFLVYRAALLATTIATGAWTAATTGAAIVSTVLSDLLLILRGRWYETAIANALASTAIDAWSIATGIASTVTGIFTGAVTALNAALWANPIVLIVAGVVALVAGLVLLYIKWRAFHNAVNATFTWIRGHWSILGPILAAPFLALPLLVERYFTQVKQTIIGVVNWIVGKLNWLIRAYDKVASKIPFLGGRLQIAQIQPIGVKPPKPIASPGKKTPHFALGGIMSSSGLALVGERGPELVTLPAGARVSPLSSEHAGALGHRPDLAQRVDLHQTVKIELDGRELTNSVAYIVTNKEARQ